MLFDENLTRVWLPATKLHRLNDVARRVTPARAATAMRKVAFEAAALSIEERRDRYCYVNMAPEFKDIVLSAADQREVSKYGGGLVCHENSVALYNCDPNPMDFPIDTEVSSVKYGSDVSESELLDVSDIFEGLNVNKSVFF